MIRLVHQMVGWNYGREDTILSQVVVSGEAGDIRGETVSSWKERLPEVVGYDAKDVWNLDETGCFWWALPEKRFGNKLIYSNI